MANNVIVGRNDLVTTHPELVREWNDTKDILTVSAGMGYKAQWKCSKEHIYQVEVFKRTSGRKCPICSGNKVLVGFNDLATTYPELAQEWADERSVESITAGSSYKAKWVCVKDHSWTAIVSNRSKGQGCPYCSGRLAIVGENDLAYMFPDLVKEWSNSNEKKPTEVTYGSGYKAEWVCSKRHSWVSSVVTRTSQSQSCPYCSNRKVLQGFNDFTTTHPELSQSISSKSKVKPTEVTFGTGKKLLWNCGSGHVFDAEPSRVIGGRWCPYCSGKRTLEFFNDLGTTHRYLVKEWDDRKNITEFSRGSTYKAQWKCLKNSNHIWKAAIGDRTRKDFPQGCPHCSNRTSKAEQELFDYIKNELELSPQKNRSILSGKELDIYVPEKNFAIEYNGLYWHTEVAGKDKYYHYNKWKECKNRGIQLIQIWEDDYNRNFELIKHMLAHKLNTSEGKKVFARNTTLVKVSAQEAQVFLNTYHIQGYKSGDHFGLKTKETGELVGIMTFKKDQSNRQLYLDRYATCCSVVGGFSKLLKYAIKQYSELGFEKIVTFAAHDVSNGVLYTKNGFKKDMELEPDYSYLNNGERKHKFGFRIKRFKTDPDLEYVEGYTEKQLAELNGIPRIWDCGKTRYILEVFQQSK